MAFDTANEFRTLGGLKSAASYYPGAVVQRVPSGVKFLRNEVFGGYHKIVGTVKYKNTPTNTPLARRVFLLREPELTLVATTFSDATTGNYAFYWIDGTMKYTVLSVDYTHNYRAVIADNLAPEAM